MEYYSEKKEQAIDTHNMNLKIIMTTFQKC
jgi:hypothetical protein